MGDIGAADFVGMTYALKQIGGFAEAGWNALVPEITALISSLVRLSIVLTAAAWVWKGSPDSVAEFLWMVVKLNVTLWFINDFWSITSMIFDSMVAAGIATAPSVDGAATTEVLKDPGAVAALSTVALTPLMKHIDTMLGPVDVFWYATELIFAYAALVTGVAVFLVFGLLIFLATAEFYVMAIPAAFMAPFIAWNKTAFIATPAIAYIVNSGIRLFGTSIVVVMGLAVMLAYQWPTEPAIQDSVNILILTIAILGIGMKVFQMLSGLVNGGPTADVGSTLGQLFTAARMGSAVGKEVQAVGSGLTSGQGAIPQGVSGLLRGGGNGGGAAGSTPAIAGPAGSGAAGGSLGASFRQGLADARGGSMTGGIVSSFKEGFASGYSGSRAPVSVSAAPAPSGGGGSAGSPSPAKGAANGNAGGNGSAGPQGASAGGPGTSPSPGGGGNAQAAPAASVEAPAAPAPSSPAPVAPAANGSDGFDEPLPPPPEWAQDAEPAGSSEPAGGGSVENDDPLPPPPERAETVKAEQSGETLSSSASQPSPEPAFSELQAPHEPEPVVAEQAVTQPEPAAESSAPVEAPASPEPAKASEPQQEPATVPAPARVRAWGPDEGGVWVETSAAGGGNGQSSGSARTGAWGPQDPGGARSRQSSAYETNNGQYSRQSPQARALTSEFASHETMAQINSSHHWSNRNDDVARGTASETRISAPPPSAQPATPPPTPSASPEPAPRKFQIGKDAHKSPEHAAEAVTEKYHRLSNGAQPDPNRNAPYETDWKERRPQEAKEVAERLARLKAGTWK